jgi:hypothetical protein
VSKGGSMFFSRKNEVKLIQDKLSSEYFEFIVLYGRRRVGKTALLHEAIKGKEAIYFIANQESDHLALERFSHSILEVKPDLKHLMTVFESWDKALSFAFDNNMILVIDEFPYLATAYPRILTLLQNTIDQHHTRSKTKLILCGSSMSFMERQILGYESPLYGRRTGQIKLKPFTFFEAKAFFDHLPLQDQFIAYGILGGIPYYLLYLKRYKTLRKALIELILCPTGHLYEEPINLLLQELREPSIYNSIINAIASGYSKNNAISTKVQMDSAKTSKYLRTLQDLHIIEKNYPDLKEKKNKAVYSIVDPLFKFWYRYVPKYRHYIELNHSEYLFDHIIQNDLPNYMGHAFEEICRQYLIKHIISNQYPWQLIDVKRWWGNNPLEKKEEEIDLIGWTNKPILFAECKWREEKTGVEVYKELQRKSLILNPLPEYYVLFSKSGFTDDLLNTKDSQLYLLDLNKLYED